MSALALRASHDAAARQAHPSPTRAQAQAGNYRKGHLVLHGLPITIENARGSTRRGIGGDGKPWESVLPAHYGYIKGTNGADGDHVDCYIGRHPASKRVFVVNQLDHETGKFDEHKCMLGYPIKQMALRDYERAFSDGKGKDRIGSVTEMSIDEFKDRLNRPGAFTKAIKRAAGGRASFAGGGTPGLSDDDVGLGVASTGAPHGLSDADVGIAPPVSTAADIAKSGAVGVGKGLIGLAGLPADAASLLNRGIDAGERLLSPTGTTSAAPATEPKFGSADLQRRVEGVTGKFYEPQTTAGKYAQTVGELAPAVVGGPEGLLTRAFTRAVIPGVASEAAGEATEGTAAEPFARAAGALAGGVGAAKAASAMNGPSVASTVGSTLAGKFGPGAIKPGTAAADFNIPLTTGEAAGDFNQIQYEQAALKGAYGEKAQKVAQQFFDQRAAAAQDAVKGVGTSLDRFGQDIVDSPIAAGETASEGLKQVAGIKKAAYKSSYDEFADMPGVIHAGALEGIGQKIKGQLTLGDNPTIIDDVTTPNASKAIRDIDQNIDRLKVQNRADPFGQPAQENIVGVNLKGIDQTRKRLVQFAQDARGAAAPGQTTADMRAMSGIIKAFDGHIEDAVANGLFSGDDRALAVLKQARAGYADYQKVFRPNKNDGGVGAVIDKIVNRQDGAGATAGEVANFLYSAAGTGASGLSSRVATRMRDILGADSPEWSGVRQGMWQRLTQATEGKDAFGPQKISQRIFEFVNGAGRATAQAMFSPQEIATMRRLASALKETVPPPGAVNYSGSAYTAASIVRNSAAAMSDALGHGIAGYAGAFMTKIGRGLLADRAAAKKVGQSLYGAPPPSTPTNLGALPVVAAGSAGIGSRPMLPAPSADDRRRRQLAAQP